MTKESKYPYFKSAFSVMEKYRKGREIVLLGDSAVFRQYLEETYGIKDPMVITMIKSKAGKGIYYIDKIQNMNDRYYIIVPGMPKSLDQQMKLFSFGYNDFEDCFFINHGPILVDTFIEDYEDEYGNRVHAPNCKVKLDNMAYNVDIRIEDGCRFGKNSVITAKSFGGSKIRIGKNCTFESEVTLGVFGDGEVNIGENTLFVRKTEIIVLGGMTLNVGKDCLFSFELKIYAGDGHAVFDLNTRKRINPQIKGNPKNLISIGDHVWVGMRAIILNRTVIGNSSIVGAGSIVKGEFPNNCVIAGTPARVVRKNITWSAESLPHTMDHIPPEYCLFTEEE